MMKSGEGRKRENTAKDGEERASHGTVDSRKSAREVKNQKITGMNTPLTSDECVCERVYTLTHTRYLQVVCVMGGK
jgi:hypothetical protein